MIDGAREHLRRRGLHGGPKMTVGNALVDQGALAIERVLLVEDMDRVKRTAESDQLRGDEARSEVATPPSVVEPKILCLSMGVD